MFRPQVLRDTADACGDPITYPCVAGTFRDRIWYATPACACPLEGYKVIDTDVDCNQTVVEIQDLNGSPVVGAFEVFPTMLGAGNFQVGAAGVC